MIAVETAHMVHCKGNFLLYPRCITLLLMAQRAMLLAYLPNNISSVLVLNVLVPVWTSDEQYRVEREQHVKRQEMP